MRVQVGEVHPRFKPRLGHIVLVESSITDPDLAPMSGTVVSVAGGRITLDVGPEEVVLPMGSRVVAAHFAPEAMYRLTATGTNVDGSLVLEDCVHLQTVQRRQWPRRAITLQVVLTDMSYPGERPVRGETIDISIGGARITSVSPVPALDDLLTAVSLPTAHTLVLASRVIESHVADDPYGYRLAFCDLDRVELGSLAALLRSESVAAGIGTTR